MEQPDAFKIDADLPEACPDPEWAEARAREKEISDAFDFDKAMREINAHQAEIEAIARKDALRDLFGTDYTASARAHRLRELVVERRRRRMDALKIYEPLTEQKKFHCSRARIRLLRGSNRGGKTLPAAVEVARAVRGLDPLGRYPLKDGRCFCVGKDSKHIGQVMWRKLFHPSALKIIRDLESREFRAFRPWEDEDAARATEAIFAPPLLPPRIVKSIGWENKKEGIPNVVTLVNGWELCFYSSLGKPPNGVDINLFWMDEEIVDEDWFPEMSARILDHMGYGIWSATPQAGTDQLFDLHERAEELYGSESPDVEEFVILLHNNPHISDDAKKAFASTLKADDHAVRIGGQFAMLSYRIYPEFSVHTHVVPWFSVPRHWTRYMVVDPGRTICAVLFAAIPPPEETIWGGHVILYDELYIPDCTADIFGKRVAEKVGQDHFYAFLIDMHGGFRNEMGVGLTVAQQYQDALRRYRVSSEITSSGFLPASDDVDAGIEAVRDLLRSHNSGRPKLLILGDRMESFIKEIKRYHHKKVGGKVVDKPDQRGECHLMDCSRYLAMYRPKFHRPKKRDKPKSSLVKYIEGKKKRSSEGDLVLLGPGGNR